MHVWAVIGPSAYEENKQDGCWQGKLLGFIVLQFLIIHVLLNRSKFLNPKQHRGLSEPTTPVLGNHHLLPGNSHILMPKAWVATA